MRRFFWVFFLVFFTASSAFAATVHLKSGKQVEGKIIETTDEYIKLNFNGIPLTYWTEEIDYIQEGENVSKNIGKSFLWKIEERDALIYLLGSIHVAAKDLYPLDRRIEDAFKACDTLVVEINVNDADQSAVQEAFLAKGTYSHGQTLRENISEETFKEAKKKIEDFGLDIDRMSNYKPWFLGFNIAVLELSKLGFDFDQGIDQHFLNEAQGSKQILDLETVDYQLSLFDGLTDQQQELFLVSALVEADILEKEIDSMFRAWKRGDVTAMTSILEKGLKEHPVLFPIYNILFYKRNEEMASKIEELLMAGGNYFVVVGAGHLVGKKGILAILEKKGYSVWQL